MVCRALSVVIKNSPCGLSGWNEILENEYTSLRSDCDIVIVIIEISVSRLDTIELTAEEIIDIKIIVRQCTTVKGRERPQAVSVLIHLEMCEAYFF
jgi:uncharacterized membrane-anchored protein